MNQRPTEEHIFLIRNFLQQWWFSFSQEALRSSQTIQLPDLKPQDLLEEELGQMLKLIALAAEEKLEYSQATAEEVSMAVFDLLEMLWSRPGCSELVDPPLAFWAGEFGYMVLQADLWASQDQLITMTEAATILQISLQSLRNKINFKMLAEYRDIHEANPRRATRLRLRDVRQLASMQAGE